MNSHHKTGSLVAVLAIVGFCLVAGMLTDGADEILALAASAAIIGWLFMHGSTVPDGKDFTQDDKG